MISSKLCGKNRPRLNIKYDSCICLEAIEINMEELFMVIGVPAKIPLDQKSYRYS
jgi:hypothetical protein